MPRKLPSVVLVGRPNVGKSTLFNRMTGSRAARSSRPLRARRAIRWRARSSGAGRTFQLSDTGGLFGASEDPLHELVVQQGQRAIAGADLLVLLVDGREGLRRRRRDDRARAARDRPAGHARDQQDRRQARPARGAWSSTSSASSRSFEISAEHGKGVGDLLDEIVERLGREGRGTAQTPRPTETAPVRRRRQLPASGPTGDAIAIVGRPNVGKSSLVNRLLREERVLVSDMPGTTRDAIDAALTWHRRQFRIVDTAGMRRPGRVRQRRQGRAGQRRRREEGHRRRRRRRARHRRRARARPIRTPRLAAKPTARARRRHRRQQVGPGEEPGPEFVEDVRRDAARTACGSSTTRRSSTSRR